MERRIVLVGENPGRELATSGSFWAKRTLHDLLAYALSQFLEEMGGECTVTELFNAPAELGFIEHLPRDPTPSRKRSVGRLGTALPGGPNSFG